MKPSQNLLAALTLLITSLAPPRSARAADAPPTPALGRNAALIYWQAFNAVDGQMKEEAFAKAVSEFNTIAIDAKVRGYVKDSVPLNLMRFAAAIEPCDWGTGMVIEEQGPYTLLPHLSKLRELARLGLLGARVRLAGKQATAAIDDLFAVYRMARHSQAGDVLISHLVGIAIEAMANQFVADHLAEFSNEDLTVLRDRFAKLAPLTHVKEAIIGEGKTFGGWMKREAAKLSDFKARQQFLALLSGKEREEAVKAIGDPPKITAMVDEMIGMYDKIAELMALPPSEFGKAHQDFQAKIEESRNPLSKMLLPAFATVHGTYHRSLAQREMLRAVLVWRLDGRAKFDTIKDPYGDGPFAVKMADDGREVSSKLTVRDQPVMMKVKWKEE